MITAINALVAYVAVILVAKVVGNAHVNWKTRMALRNEEGVYWLNYTRNKTPTIARKEARW